MNTKGLLQTSQIMAICGRTLHPCEHLALLGVPVFPHHVEAAGVATGLASPSVMRALSAEKIRSLAGNGMHVSSVGLMLVYVLACTEKLRR